MALLDVTRVSHVGLNVRDVQAQEAFYTEFVGLKRTAAFYAEVLGFRPSGWVAESFVWMRCNPDHHGLAFAEAGGKVALHHMAFEVLDFADLAHQADHLMRHGHRLLYGPGRHGPG